MSKELILKLESDLEELEKLIQTKQSLLVQAFENHTTTPISEIITKVKEITLQKEFIVMKQGITDFKTLKESLRTDITKEDINFIEELQKKLLHFKELFEHELKEEQKLNSEDTNLESIKNKIQELREEFKELESSKNILFELLNKHSKSNTLKIKEARRYLLQFNFDYLKTISDEFVVDLHNLGLKSGEKANDLFIFGIPAIMPFVEKNPSYWPQIGEDLVSLSLKSGENVEWLFEYGIPAVMPFVEENKFTINKALQFLDFLIQKYPERIEDLMITLTDVESEINSDEDLNLFWSYIKDFSILDLDTFKYYKSLNPEQRKKHLNNCIERYQKIVNGEKIKYTKEDLPFLYHAINSRNLSQNEMKSTLQKYEQQIHSLPKLNYDEFEFSIKEVREIKLTGSLTEKLFNYYREMFKHITQTKEILKINYLDYFTNNKKIEQPTLGVEYSSEIAWRSIIYNIYQNLGEDTQNKINKILNLEYNSNHKELSEVYYALEELYNDTVKDNPLNLDDKTQTLFLEYHRSLSQIDKLLKEVKKFKEVEGEGFKLVKCYPSKEPIDLFYGYYGENCTSSAPAELLNPNFLPVRLIIDNQIQGCLHFYFTEFGNKKILAILGIEPRSWLCNNLNNKKFFDECLKSFIKFAKKYNFDMVALPVNPTMHSNRGQISSLIAEEIRNKKQIDLNPDIEFPKNHEGYKTNGLRVIWKKGFF